MAKISDLLLVTDEERKAILKHYSLDESDLKEKLKYLLEWVKISGYPYEENIENRFRIMLMNAKMSTERTKQTIRAYYEMRIRYPDFFTDLIPGTDFYHGGKKYMRSVVLPKLTPDLCRINVIKLNDPDGEAANGFVYEVIPLMQAELRLKSKEEFFLSNILLFDLENYSLKNLLKYTPSINNQLVNIMLSTNLRIQNIHIVNLSPMMDKLMLVFKTVLPAKFVDRITSHNTFDSLYEFIPKECLPADYGGPLPSVEELHAKWCEVIEDEKEFFEQLVSRKCEIIPQSRGNYEIFGGGIEGSFKKLNID